MYPAAADPAALYALSETSDSQTVIYNDGRVYAYVGRGSAKRAYKGILDYLVTPGGTVQTQVQIIELGDENGDSYEDYYLVYPNGDRQMMYQCAPCFE